MSDERNGLLSAARSKFRLIHSWLDGENGASSDELNRGVLTLSTQHLEEIADTLGMVLHAEEARLAKEGTVERVQLLDFHFIDGAPFIPVTEEQMVECNFYAERPLPPPKPGPKKRLSAEEKLDMIAGEMRDEGHNVWAEWSDEAAAELRRLKGGRA